MHGKAAPVHPETLHFNVFRLFVFSFSDLPEKLAISIDCGHIWTASCRTARWSRRSRLSRPGDCIERHRTWMIATANPQFNVQIPLSNPKWLWPLKCVVWLRLDMHLVLSEILLPNRVASWKNMEIHGIPHRALILNALPFLSTWAPVRVCGVRAIHIYFFQTNKSVLPKNGIELVNAPTKGPRSGWCIRCRESSRSVKRLLRSCGVTQGKIKISADPWWLRGGVRQKRPCEIQEEQKEARNAGC
jgi:hypothetical protein